MNIRFATNTEIEIWNELLLTNPDGGNVFQSKQFTMQQQQSGWKPLYIIIDSLAITVLEKTIIGLGKLWYLPKGPGIITIRQLSELLSDLAVFGKSQNVFVIKIEPELLDNNETRADLMKSGLTKVSSIQPNFSTIKLDISLELDTVLSNLNQKGRHAIKRAQRDGVTTQLVNTTDENCQTMYALLAKTAEGSFRIRSYNYYKTFWQRFYNAGLGQLFFAYVDGQIVAGAYAIVFGNKSTYKDGASIRERTVYGASHLLQWRIIEWAKTNGSSVHDLCGSPPSNEIKNSDHPHYGIGRFKSSFSKNVTDYVGTWDLPVNSNRYKLWIRFGERIVVRIHNYRYHENWY